MGLGAMKKKSKGSTTSTPAAKAKKNLVTVGSLRKSSFGEDQYYITATRDTEKFKAPGKLLFQDAKTGQIYLINTIALYTPHPNASAKVPGLEYNLVLNLESDSKAVTPIGAVEGASDEAEDTGYDNADFDSEELDEED